MFAAVLLITFVTYARVPPAELYHVSRDGLAGGLGRALVELNYPDALAAVPLALIAADALRTTWSAVLPRSPLPPRSGPPFRESSTRRTWTRDR
jgi:hypothetical protein